MSAYIAKQPNKLGYVAYSEDENRIWQMLYNRQCEIIEGRATQAYCTGLDRLELSADSIPQIGDVSRCLQEYTGWSVQAVPALIPFEAFFQLLANQQFPVATFIRNANEIDYLQEPDIFHEIFGHCPMLTDKTFAQFVCEYGRLGLSANPLQRRYLARLFWYTVEFGLKIENDSIKAYGAGILSSPGETVFAIDTTNEAKRHEFSLMQALRTPYRIDTFQKHYFVINEYQELFELFDHDLISRVDEAIKQGDFETDVFETNKTVSINYPIETDTAIGTHDC